ncbi:hypothetical protein MRB53_002640 [Persea americana]|uniref:Uncharacterized protein n=1 Tax=Persea americana TaxID=3435 RepID=A0ACC2MUY1_PERAE|nr:hypothetical protein MRB53_002640 [Persea americana]
MASRPKKSSQLAEQAGTAAAHCVAVTCCVPCAVADMLVLTTVKVPAGLYRKALRRRKKTRMGSVGLLQPKRYEDMEFSVDTVSWESWPEKSPSREVLDMEEMLLRKFSSSTTGFWRNPSEIEQQQQQLY